MRSAHGEYTPSGNQREGAPRSITLPIETGLVAVEHIGSIRTKGLEVSQVPCLVGRDVELRSR